MLTISDEKIKEIAESINAGLICYYHIKTGDIISCPDPVKWLGVDDEEFEEELKNIEEDCDNYIVFEGMETHESSRVMEDFAHSVEDNKLQAKLFNALNRRKPFANFKNVIDESGDHRQKWFDFENARYIEWVKYQIEFNKI
jgi:wyosine [tRNA(Phe)-imidazoG37] synthetase (radical SAM superfamily)